MVILIIGGITGMKIHYVYFCLRIGANPGEPYKYIGVRSCEGNPEDDIGIRYVSSSEYVKKDMEKYGRDKFKWKVIKTFEDRKEAEDYELYLHKKFKVGHNNSYYNKNYGQCYDITTHNRKKYTHKKSKEELHEIYSKCQKERFKDLREIYKVSCFGEDNGMWNKGYLLEGEKNGRSQKIKVTLPNKCEIIFPTKISATSFFNVDRQFITNVINRGGIFYLTPNMNISFVNKMKKYNGMKIEEL